ncbi:hypothetical protein KKH27_13455 [bacterium]|nr:hypothetical protein [bacterium]
MAPEWASEFHDRMDRFETLMRTGRGGVPVSIKVRVTSGCFHREHSPHAYELIDRHLRSIPQEGREFTFEEHESGPEVLVYVAAGVTLASSVIQLVAAIIKARADGIKKGDRPSEPVELIIRRVLKNGEFREEKILRFRHNDAVDKDAVQEKLVEAAGKLVDKHD